MRSVGNRRVFGAFSRNLSNTVNTNTIPQWISQQSQQWKHKDLLRDCSIEKGRWTFEEFDRMVREHGAGLLDARFRSQDTIVLIMNEPTENIVSYIGSTYADLRLVQLDAASLDASTLRRVLLETNARGVIVSHTSIPLIYSVVPDLKSWPNGLNYRFAEFPSLKMVIHTSRWPIEGLYNYAGTFSANSMPDTVDKIRKSQKPSSLVEYAGTTHADLLSGAAAFSTSIGHSFQDRVLVDLPQNSRHGITCGILSCINSAALMVSTGLPTGDGTQLAEALSSEFVTSIIATPQSLSSLLSQKIADDVRSKVSSIGIVISPSSAAKKTKQLQQELAGRFPQLKGLHVYYANDSLSGASPLFHSGNLLAKGAVFSDSVGKLLQPSKHAKIDLSTVGSYSTDGLFTLR